MDDNLFSRIFLPTFPISDFVGLMSLQVGLFAKFGFVVLKCYECVFAGCSFHPVVDSQFRRDVFLLCMLYVPPLPSHCRISLLLAIIILIDLKVKASPFAFVAVGRAVAKILQIIVKSALLS